MGAELGSLGRSEAKRFISQPEFGKYAEDDEEDYEDVFGKLNGNGESTFTVKFTERPHQRGISVSQPMQTLQLNTRLSNKSWVCDLSWTTLYTSVHTSYSSGMTTTTKIRLPR